MGALVRIGLRSLHALALLVAAAAPAHAQFNGVISGVVRDVAGAPIPNARVELATALRTSTWSTTTNSSGAFSFTFLRADTYGLVVHRVTHVSSTPFPYAPAIFGSTCAPWRCDAAIESPITLGTDQHMTGLDFRLQPESRAVLRLLDAVTGTVARSVGQIFLYDGEGHIVTQFADSGVVPDAFVFGRLAAGSYYALAIGSFEYVSEVSDGRHCLNLNSCAIVGGTPFVVTAGGSTNVDILLDRYGSISGRITDQTTGLPLSSVRVEAYTDEGHTGNSTFSRADGTYELTRISGRFVLLARDDQNYAPEFYPDVPAKCQIEFSSSTALPPCLPARRAAGIVDVPVGASITGRDFALTRGADLTAAVSVNGPMSPFVTATLTARGGTIVRTQSTSVPRTFLVSRALPAGEYYLCIAGDGVRAQTYGGQEFPSKSCPVGSGTPIVVTASQSVTLSMTLNLVPPTEQPPGGISGSVRTAQGQPISTTIRVEKEDGSFAANAFAGSPTGAFLVPLIPPGRYFVRTEAPINYVNEWFGGACVGCSDGRGTLVNVAPGVNVTGIDFVLEEGGRVTGTATAPTAPMTVVVFDRAGRRMASTFAPGSGLTYTVSGLPSGTYFVKGEVYQFSGDRRFLADVIYSNVPCLATDCPVTSGTPVVVTAGQTTPNIDLRAQRSGVIRGRVTLAGVHVDNRGEVRTFIVQAFDGNGTAVGRYVKLANGYYEIQGLTTGVYFVRTIGAETVGAANQTWRDNDCAGCAVTDGTPVPVADDVVTNGIDFTLHPGSTLRGRVVESGTAVPLDNVTIRVLAEDGTPFSTGVTAPDGSYVVAGLPGGRYFVETDAVSGHVNERYPNVQCVRCTPADGQIVVVSEGVSLTNIDFALDLGSRVAGIVTTQSAGLPGLQVAIVDASGLLLGEATTGADGRYIVTTPAGTSFARTEARSGFATQMFDRQSCPHGVCDSGSATPLTLTAGQLRSDVDFPLTSCAVPPVLYPPLLPPAIVASSYSASLAGSPEGPAYRFGILHGSLPPGVLLQSTTGVLSGVPASTGHYQFTAGITDSAGCGSTRPYTLEVRTCSVTIAAAELSFLSTGGSASVRVSGACNWSSASGSPWIVVTQAADRVTISAAANGGALRIGAVAVGGKSIVVRQAGQTSSGPFGSLDVPADNSTVAGSVAVGGWALDDLEIQRVRIFRDPVDGEPQGGLVFIGDAVRVRGARPDVERLFPSAAFRDRAGWGFLLLTNMLPNRGNGTFRLHAFAFDIEGNQTLLGSRTIVAANATSTRPFGAIDTPGQGETIRGASYINFGWALTTLPKMIPRDGSTILVLIDGVVVGTVNYGHHRIDIATLFPGLNNSLGAVGYRIIDTTQLADGIHTISWIVIDNLGVTQGIGSRYFHVDNSGASSSATGTATAASGGAAGDAQQSESQSEPQRITSATVLPQEDVRRVHLREMGLLELDLGSAATTLECAATYSGSEIVDGSERPLPVGSSLDPQTGAFKWQPGPGFVGNYRLAFTATACDGRQTSVPIDVTIARSPR